MNHQPDRSTRSSAVSADVSADADSRLDATLDAAFRNAAPTAAPTQFLAQVSRRRAVRRARAVAFSVPAILLAVAILILQRPGTVRTPGDLIPSGPIALGHPPADPAHAAADRIAPVSAGGADGSVAIRAGLRPGSVLADQLLRS